MLDGALLPPDDLGAALPDLGLRVGAQPQGLLLGGEDDRLAFLLGGAAILAETLLLRLSGGSRRGELTTGVDEGRDGKRDREDEP